MNINEELKRIRKAKRRSITEVAEALNLSSSYISRLEHGKQNPSFKVVQKLLDHYGFKFRIIRKR